MGKINPKNEDKKTEKDKEQHNVTQFKEEMQKSQCKIKEII